MSAIRYNPNLDSYLASLPMELQVKIMGHTTGAAATKLSNVSRSLRNAYSLVKDDENFWKEKSIREISLAKPEGMTWKEFYQLNYSPFKIYYRDCPRILKAPIGRVIGSTADILAGAAVGAVVFGVLSGPYFRGGIFMGAC